MKFTFVLPEECGRLETMLVPEIRHDTILFYTIMNYSIFMLQFRNIRCLVTYQQNTTCVDVKIH